MELSKLKEFVNSEFAELFVKWARESNNNLKGGEYYDTKETRY